MAEYRLDDLARVSGVSARNIRAYRERGLLDAPRRVGRSAYYDDYHLSQLKTINQLLRKGFNSAHIAEFFASMRQGADLADILGIRRAVLGPPAGEAIQNSHPVKPSGTVLNIDPDGDEARRLLEYGLASRIGGAVSLADTAMADIVARSPNQLLYVRAILRIFESTRESVDNMANSYVAALHGLYTERFGPDHIPTPGEMAELRRTVLDYGDLGNRVVADQLNESIRRTTATAVSDFAAGIVLSDSDLKGSD